MVPLDECLGIRRPYGPRSVSTQQALENRDRFYAKTIESLKTVYRLLLEDASRIAADLYTGSAPSLKTTVIEGKWNSSAWKAYKKIPDTESDLRPDAVGHKIPRKGRLRQDTADSPNVAGGKKQSKRVQGTPLTQARLLMPIAVYIALAKKIPSERSACLKSIEDTISSAKWISDPYDYLPRIKKVLEDKKTYRHPSEQLTDLATILREARDDPQNPLEIPKSKSPKKSKGDPLLSYL